MRIKKIKKNKDVHFLVTENEFLKLMLLCGEEYSIAEKLRYYINMNFKNTYQTNDVDLILKQENRDVVNEYRKQLKIKEKQNTTSISQDDLEDAKAAFIARRNDRLKKGDVNDC